MKFTSDKALPPVLQTQELRVILKLTEIVLFNLHNSKSVLIFFHLHFRLSHLFMLTPNMHWIIVEDSEEQTELVKNFLIQANLNKRSTVLNIKTPDQFKLKGKDPNWKKPRGAEQRNLALDWIRKNADPNQRSMVFFMDDDNTYSLELFTEIAKIEEGHVGVWPVGLVGGLMVEKPILNENNEVIGFNAAWRPERPFPIDMAGFAISTDLLLKFSKAVFSYEVERGYQESEILRQITNKEDLQPLANLCTKVLVWHTRTEKTKLVYEEKLIKNQQPRSDQGLEV